MIGMRRQDSDYRGWKLCITVDARCKALGHAVRGEPPCEVIRSEGWGESLVLAELRRHIDAFEEAAPSGPSPAGREV
jgi:hypothetical protein